MKRKAHSKRAPRTKLHTTMAAKGVGKKRKGDCDRMLELPDSIIHHILSLLPTINVVWTSILSKRWRPLWASVPALDLCDQYSSDSTMFEPK
ncbi:F-box domain containing protein [Parasponia andersonii]|uniref:F-box domain containing protein n=1 Tax=Parasponia andersonii TaxID=3476 RepID=A0A2P5E4W1_PARAD|nr:F-box domain containing protein [Parasponia andersonii]